jgi:hypothetical protein
VEPDVLEDCFIGLALNEMSGRLDVVPNRRIWVRRERRRRHVQ